MPTTSPSPSRSQSRRRADAIQSPFPSVSIVLPEGQVDDEAAELLHEFVHSHTPTPVEESPDPITYETGELQVDKVALEAQRLERTARPSWQRPSATWFIVLSPLSMLAVSALIAPRLQLYTYLMCNELDTGSIRPVPCVADPVVQANVAKLLTITGTVQGILSCLTATFWGSFSDRYGRVQYLSLNLTTVLLSDAALAALAVVPEYVPGGYWFLVYTSAMEGLVGAYLADCSDPATRSRIFSRFLGLVFIGVAFGPTLGGLVGHLLGNPYFVFYLALGMHAINVLFSWFVIPESLLPAQMDAARRARGGRKGRWFSWVFNFLAPLAVLAPLPQKGSVSPQRALKKDWSLTWLALSFAPESLVFGSVQYWLQYAAGKFNWTGEIVGYYISIIGITRALFLVVGLPAILRFFVPKRPPVHLPTSPNEPLDTTTSTVPPAASREPIHTHTPAVDLGLAKVSIALQVIYFALLAVSRDARVFVAVSVLGALALFTRRGGAPSEAGRLFGAMSVIQTIGTQVVGPPLFGVVYINTVAAFPEAMFYVLMVVVSISLFFLFLVRIPPDPEAVDGAMEAPAVIDVPTIVLGRRVESTIGEALKL
ncbi:major facilitator superfamily domain-containing protein [Russula brevipes]|nr:major facilitator superfamily domain-containing protein [Russula brevipes]